MPCYHPLHGYRSQEVNDSGKRSIVFNPRDGYSDMPVTVPCGQCIGCRLERSRQWAVRCVHEASMYEDNCFITLTFNDQNLPLNSSLNKSDFQKFMKRLRKYYNGKKIRYFHCGEYGSKLDRPHHHACLFNIDFEDKVLWSIRRGVKLYRSAILEKLWPYGFCTVGDVTFESAAYVARYVVKKITGKNADDHYRGRVPEYVTMSRRSGLGHDWFMKFKSDVFPHDFVVVRGGLKCKPPKYYDSIYDELSHSKFSSVKRGRERSARESEHNTPERLEVRETIKKSRIKLCERSFENDNANV